MSQPASSTNVDHKEVKPAENTHQPEEAKVIEPTVNKTPQTKPETKPQTTLENNSIIKQKDNQIPSLKDDSKNHKQNLPASNMPQQKPVAQIKHENPPPNQAESHPAKVESTSNPTPIAQIPQQQIDHSKAKSGEVSEPVSETKIQPSKTQKTAQKSEKPGEKQVQKPVQKPAQKPVQKPVEKPAQKPVENTHKAQQPQPQSIKSNDHHPQTQKPAQKSTKQVQSSKQIKKEEHQLAPKPEQKTSEKNISEKPQEKVTQQSKNEQIKPKQGHSAKQSKVIDTSEHAQPKQVQETKKKETQNLKKSQKDIPAKTQPAPSQKPAPKQQPLPTEDGVTFNDLLKSLLEKCKQKQEKAKSKAQANVNVIPEISTDLNLSLASQQTAGEYPQNRIKLQFKVLQKKVSNQKQPEQTQKLPEQIGTNAATDKKQSDFKVAFYLYNLKDPKSKSSTEAQKEKIKNAQDLQKKLEEVTSSLDKNAFSLKVSDKDDSEPEKNKLPLRTVKLNLEPTFVSSSFGIKPQRLDELQNLLKSLEIKSQKSEEKHKTESHEVQKEQGQSPKKQKVDETQKAQKTNLVSFTTSGEVTLSEPLKSIESTKFLSFLSNGFKMRIQSKANQNQTTASNLLGKALREAIFSLAPSLFSEYLTSISSGNVNIKFRSIKDLKKLLGRLGIAEIFDETPSTQEVLKDLIQVQLKSLFKVKPKAQKSEKEVSTSEIWKVVKAIFAQAICQGLSIELTLYQRFAVRLTIECCSKNINEVWSEALK